MFKESELTIGDLKKFARGLSKFDMSNYDAESYRLDKYYREKGRRAAQKQAAFYWDRPDEKLIQGKFFSARLIIEENRIEYVVGQYAPTEIYWALEDYFKAYHKEMYSQTLKSI